MANVNSQTQSQTPSQRFGEVVVSISVSNAVIDKIKSITQNKITYNTAQQHFERASPTDPDEYASLAEQFNQIIRQRVVDLLKQAITQNPQKIVAGKGYDIVVDLDGQLEQMLVKAYNSSMLWLIYKNEIVPKIKKVSGKIRDSLKSRISKTIEQLSTTNVNDARKQFIAISKDYAIDALTEYIDDLKDEIQELSDEIRGSNCYR